MKKNKKSKKSQVTIFIIIGILIVVAIAFVFVLGRTGLDLQGEDSWIKDSRGVYVKHGNPSQTPEQVKEQQDAIVCALNLYNAEKEKGTEFNSQCLGVCNAGTGESYAVDIVHVPRTSEDDKTENQCEAYRNGNAKHFIELDSNGNVVGVV